MSIWVIVLLLGVVAMVVGPVMLLQPSPRDRRQIRLGVRARALGLVVRLETLPVQPRDLETSKRLPVYCLPIHPAQPNRQPRSWQLLRANYSHEMHFLGVWRWQGRGRPEPEVMEVLERSLPELPNSVLALGGDNRGWYLAWTEAGGVALLEQLAELLQGFKRAFQDQSARPARESGSD